MTIKLLPQFQGTEAIAPKKNGRFYKINGVNYRRVSSVLQVVPKPALVPWARKNAFEKATSSAYSIPITMVRFMR